MKRMEKILNGLEGFKDGSLSILMLEGINPHMSLYSDYDERIRLDKDYSKGFSIGAWSVLTTGSVIGGLSLASLLLYISRR
ncbi:MAG: hypothetical protein AABY03_02265 [Nanoarchaeota archaeon]